MKLRLAFVVGAAAALVGCGGPEATVGIADVEGTDAVKSGEYEADAVEVKNEGDGYRVSVTLEDDEPCTTITLAFCADAESGTLSPVRGDWSCNSAAADMYQPNAFTVGVNVVCHDTFSSWRNDGNDATIALDDDEVHLEFEGRLDGNGTTAGAFTLSFEATFSKDDAEEDG